MSQKRVFFIMPNLGGGGGERIISILLNNIDRSLYQSNLIIIKKKGSNEFIKNLRPDVNVFYLGISSRIRISFPFVVYKLVRFSKKYKPDVLFFGSGQINAILSPFLFLFSKNIKLIARESNIPSQFEKNNLVKFLYRVTYKNFDKIIVQSDDMYNDLNFNFNLPNSKLIKINNPIDLHYIQSKINQPPKVSFTNKGITLLAVGRLTHQKGFDILIKELSKLKELEFHLYILGEGEERQNLLSLINLFELKNKVSLLGNVENPYNFMVVADVFVLSSRFEGFPNVLLESLSCGTPVLANKCLGGIDEIIKTGFNGDIFEFKKNDFGEKLAKFVNTDFDKLKIIEDIQSRFSVDHKIIEFQKTFEL